MSPSRIGKASPLFLILLLLLIPLSAQASITSITTAHPRLWITPNRLSRMKIDATNNTARWTNLLNAANSALNTTGDTDPDDIVPLALVYQVKGTAKYATAAINIMLANAVPSNDLTGDDEYAYRYVLPDMAAGLDWCYAAMSTAQRQQVATWLMDRADFVWPDTNPSRLGAWAVADPADNYFPGFLTTWVAAIAAYGDDTKTGTVSGSNRPLYHVNLGLQKYNDEVLPWAASWGNGGMYAESTNYDLASTFHLAIILDGHKTATGQDLINASTPGSTFLHDSLYYDIYSTVPGLDQYYPLGDQSRQSMPDLVDYNRMRAYAAVADINDTTLAQYTKYWLDHINPNIGQWSFTSAWEFLYYNPAATSANYTTALPTSHFVPGPGILFRRSDWTTSATFFGIWAGPDEEGHQDGDVNGFLIYKGDWLAANANIYSQSGIEQATYDYNDITFGSQPLIQDWQTPDSTWPLPAGQTVVQDNTSEFTYFAGQGAQAYTLDRAHDGWVTKASQQVCKDYMRKLVYVAPNTFLVYDRVTLANAALSKNWHLHSPKPITVNGRNYKFDNGKYRLFGQSLLPANGTTLSTVNEMLGSGGTLSSYRLDAVTSNNTATDRLLNVFQLAPVATSSVTPAVEITATSGNMDGAQVNGWVVMMGRTESVTSATYSFTSSKTTQHLLVDLVPSTKYVIEIGSSVSTATTDASGSLRFSAAAGTRTVKVIEETHNAVASLQVVAPASAQSGVPLTFTVVALDANGLVASTDANPVHFTSNDATAVLPANATLTGGVGTFQATLKAGGTDTITATDTVTTSIKGSASVAVTSSTGTATFVKVDTTTLGSWKGVYGHDGWNVIGDTSANNPTYPSYASVTAGSHLSGVWTPSTSTTSCLQKSATSSADRMAGVWYQTSWTMNVGVSGTHQLALYLLDFHNSGYGESITIKDTSTGTVLDTRSASNFAGGEYLVWNVNGSVTVTLTSTSSVGHWAVLSGLFFN